MVLVTEQFQLNYTSSENSRSYIYGAEHDWYRVVRYAMCACGIPGNNIVKNNYFISILDRLIIVNVINIKYVIYL